MQGRRGLSIGLWMGSVWVGLVGGFVECSRLQHLGCAKCTLMVGELWASHFIVEVQMDSFVSCLRSNRVWWVTFSYVGLAEMRSVHCSRLCWFGAGQQCGCVEAREGTFAEEEECK